MKTRFKLVPVCAAFAVWQPAAIAQSAEQAQAATPSNVITVSGKRATRQVSELRADDLAAEVPGTSPLKAAASLPGVNFQSADPFGAYEWSTKVSIRGFSQNQLGFTLDDVPLGDMSYRNHNGLHISRAIASENVGNVLLSQGAGALGTASSSNLGGTVQFRSREPSKERAINVQQTIGENSMRRTFLRLDTGVLGDSTRLSFSLADQRAEKWKGEGDQTQQQFNAKLVSETDSGRFSAFVNYSDRKEIDYQDLSKEMIARLGPPWDNYYPDWNAALQSAGGQWSRGETSVDDAYYAGAGIRRDWLAGATLDLALNDSWRLKATAYRHQDRGPSLWYTPYRASSPSVPISLRTVNYGIQRSGVIGAVSAQAGDHDLSAGLWLEDNRFDQAMRFHDLAGEPASAFDVPGVSATAWNYRFRTRTAQFHVQDTFHWTPALTAEAGFRALQSRITPQTLSGPVKDGAITARNGFLPQLGVNYQLGGGQEVFSSVSKNMRAFKGSAMEDSPFATTAAGFEAIKGNLKPETSTSWELGWRQRSRGLEASLTAYHIDFRNRLLGIQQGSAIQGNPVVLANVGRVSANGAEAAFAWSGFSRWRLLGSASYNDARYRDDFVDNSSLVAVGGKQVVDSPRWLASLRINYDDGWLLADLGASHVGYRQYTYTNDNGVGAYTLWSAGIGLHGATSGWIKAYRVKLGVENLSDARYVASIGTNGFVSSDPQGRAQTLLIGAPRSAYLSASADF